MIGNNWGRCNPADPRNRRTRVSVLVEEGGKTILIDASPDMRQQLLVCDLKNLDAVMFTHAHADHCHGIDELRSVNWLTKKPIDIYADPVTMDELKTRFDYIFKGTSPGKFYSPSVTTHEINGPFDIGDVHVVPFAQNHGPIQSLGYRIKDFAYSTDAHELDEAAFAALAGVKVWVVDCAREEPHPTHAHLAKTLEWIARVKPQQAYLTHMNETLDYATLAAKLPAGTVPAHDGLVIEC